MTIKEIEDKLIDTIKALEVFRVVDSLGRREKPTALNYPSVFVYFASDKDTGTRPRPVYETVYEVLVINKNLRSEKDAANDTYTLIDLVQNAINGKSLEITDIEPFICTMREISAYEDGVITYTLQFTTRHYLSVPTE